MGGANTYPGASIGSLKMSLPELIRKGAASQGREAWMAGADETGTAMIGRSQEAERAVCPCKRRSRSEALLVGSRDFGAWGSGRNRECFAIWTSGVRFVCGWSVKGSASARSSGKRGFEFLDGGIDVFA